MLGSAGGGVELTKVVLGGFVGVELLVYVQLSGRHKYTKKHARRQQRKDSHLGCEYLHLKHRVPTLPSALLPAACCDGLSESSGSSSVLMLSSAPHLPLLTASGNVDAKLPPDPSGHHAASNQGKTKGVNI